MSNDQNQFSGFMTNQAWNVKGRSNLERDFCSLLKTTCLVTFYNNFFGTLQIKIKLFTTKSVSQ